MNYTADVIKAEEELLVIKRMPITNGLDSWKERMISIAEERLSKLPKEAVDYARLIIEKDSKELKDMSTNRKTDRSKFVVKGNDELGSKFYF